MILNERSCSMVNITGFSWHHLKSSQERRLESQGEKMMMLIAKNIMDRKVLF
jgi:hypothetical protein